MLDAAHRLLRLPEGFYGLSTILLMVAFMTRVRTPEALRYQAPGEWGIVLGLDRCPEVKTLRRKLALIAGSQETVRDWQATLARSWLEGQTDDWMTMAVDGHRQGLQRTQGQASPALHCAPEALSAGLRELLDHRPGWQTAVMSP